MLLEWVIANRNLGRNLNRPPTFRELQHRNNFFERSYSDVPLLEPTKVVIGSCLPSSRALPLGTQILVSYANIVTWDVFLRSLLSCPLGWLFTSKSVSRHQPKRFSSPEYHCWSSTRNAVSHTLFVIWLGPSHQQDDFTGFQCAYSLDHCQ